MLPLFFWPKKKPDLKMLHLADYRRDCTRVFYGTADSYRSYREVAKISNVLSKTTRTLVRNPRSSSLTSSRLNPPSRSSFFPPRFHIRARAPARSLLLLSSTLRSPIFRENLDLFNLDAKAISRAVIACQPHCACL